MHRYNLNYIGNCNAVSALSLKYSISIVQT